MSDKEQTAGLMRTMMNMGKLAIAPQPQAAANNKPLTRLTNMTSSKKMTKAYWAATSVFATLLLMDGIGGVTRSPLGEEVLLHLGYPLYLMPLLGGLKILAAVAVVQGRFTAVKEWAYAGFAFNCLGAFVSRFVVGDSGIDLWFPWIFLLFGAVPYALWKTAAEPYHRRFAGFSASV